MQLFVFCFLSWLMVLKLPKIVPFLRFFADVKKKSMYMHLKVLVSLFKETLLVILLDISVWS